MQLFSLISNTPSFLKEPWIYYHLVLINPLQHYTLAITIFLSILIYLFWNFYINDHLVTNLSCQSTFKVNVCCTYPFQCLIPSPGRITYDCATFCLFSNWCAFCLVLFDCYGCCFDHQISFLKVMHWTVHRKGWINLVTDEIFVERSAVP